jgi:hypothetical protein
MQRPEAPIGSTLVDVEALERFCETSAVELEKKLQLTVGQPLETLHVPDGVSTAVDHLPTATANVEGSALLVFVNDRATLEQNRLRIVDAVKAGRTTWVSYPKGGQLGTDLNRDSLAALLAESDVQPVRQISVDDVWSALRFRPGH